LHGIALRVSLRARAAAARRRQREQETPVRCTDSGRAELVELAAVLDDQLAQLPAKYRDPLVLCYLEGLTRAEAAKQLGWSLRTVMRRMDLGRELLRRRLIRHGVTLSATLCAAALGQHFTAAPVTAALLSASVRHALSLAAGKAAGAAVPAKVLALADGVMRAMAVKLKIALAVTLLTIGSAVAAFTLTHNHDDDGTPAVAPTQAAKAEALTVARLKLLRPERDPSKLPPDARPAGGRKKFRHGGPVSSVAFMPNGKAVVSASDDGQGSIRWWDVKSGEELYSVELNSPVFVLALSKAGNLLAAAGEDRLIRLWDGNTGNGLGILRGHDAAVYSLVFADDGKTLFSGDYAGTIRLWDTAGRKAIDTLSTPGHGIHTLAISPEGKTLAAACQKMGEKGQPVVQHPIRLWDLVTRQERGHIDYAHAGPVFAVAFSADGNTLASAGRDGEVRIWNVASGKLVRELWRATFGVQTLAFSPLDGMLAGGSTDTWLYTWDSTTGRPLWKRQAHPFRDPGSEHGRKFAEIDWYKGTTALAFSPNGTLVSGGSNGRLRVWERNGKERRFDD
jgi:WD40 repeat protein